MSKSAMLTLLVVLLVGGLIAISLRGVREAHCEVCITFKGETACRSGEGRTQEDAQDWLETIGRAVATGRLSDRQAQAAIRAVSEWVRTAGERATAEVVDELRAEVDRVKREMAARSIKAVG